MILVKALRSTVQIVFSILLMLALAFSALAASEPKAPLYFTRGASSTMNETNFGTVQTDALAGNITQLTLTGISQTRSWQGYYGNVTGWITLDDANNFTFYNWSDAEPRGQVYASLVSAGTPNWPTVDCTNFSTEAATFDTKYSINPDDYDNVTNTYNVTNHPQFQIIDRNVSGCPTTYIWRDDLYQSNDFVNVLLSDTNNAGTDRWVFGTIMENKDVSNKTDKTCYNGELCDFQLLVAENGHGTDIAVTPYYFWVDITG